MITSFCFFLILYKIKNKTENTAIVALCHCHWTDGTLLDIEAIGIIAHSEGRRRFLREKKKRVVVVVVLVLSYSQQNSLLKSTTFDEGKKFLV